MSLITILVFAQSALSTGYAPPVRVPIDRTTEVAACEKQLTSMMGAASERKGRIAIDGQRLGQLGYSLRNYVPFDSIRRLDLKVLGTREQIYLELDESDNAPIEWQACWKMVTSWQSRFAGGALSTWDFVKDRGELAILQTEFQGGTGCDSGSGLQQIWYARANVRVVGFTDPQRAPALLDLVDAALDQALPASETERTVFVLSEDGKAALGAQSREEYESVRAPIRHCKTYRRAQARSDVKPALTVERPVCGTAFDASVERIAVEGVTKRQDITRVIIKSERGRHEVDVDENGRFVQVIELIPGDNIVTVKPLIPTTETSSGWTSPDMFTLYFVRAGD